MALRRGIFQLHLLTAIVLLFSACGLISLNASSGRLVGRIEDYRLEPNNLYDPIITKKHMWGWPRTATEFDPIQYMVVTQPGTGVSFNLPIQRTQIIWPAFWWNMAVGLGLLALVAAACEFVLRMRKRPGFFQIHLLTAILLMFAAGGLIGLNVGKVEDVLVAYELNGSRAKRVMQPIRIWGWPIEVVELQHQHSYATGLFTKLSAVGLDPCEYDTNLPVTSWPKAWGDAGVALVVLLGVAFVVEWLLRRKRRHA